MTPSKDRIVVIGAGIGGLAAAARLAHAGCDVTVLERASTPGGKMRTMSSAAGPVDAGPTVLTMKPVFKALFEDLGETLSDHVTLAPLEVLALHHWDDGTSFRLFAKSEQTLAEARDVFGTKAADQIRTFQAKADRLFDAFDAPMMQAARPSQLDLTIQVARSPRLLLDMAPWRNLAKAAFSHFSDPRLAQLYARYATYVGGSPWSVPALLSLVSASEARGVWAVDGGMAKLALAVEGLAKKFGAAFHYGEGATRIERQSGRIAAVQTQNGRYPADRVLFNGDPRALSRGLLGEALKGAISPAAVEPRSLSAHVLAFAARPKGGNLAHHTVFFGHDPRAEFEALERGAVPQDATLYLCAQDHGAVAPDALQRFELIRNAPPDPTLTKENVPWQTLIFDRLAAFGLTFDPRPQAETLTGPAEFDALFPASQGSLYGRSPSGLTAGLKRPTARTAIPVLYLVGGGAHPGAGIPMATLSARHAAEAILQDRTSTSPSRLTATPGGMSTA